MFSMTVSFTFLITLVVFFALFYAFESGPPSVGGRLSRLWRPVAARQKAGFARAQKERLERFAWDLGKIVPSTEKRVAQSVRLLLRAGFRRSESAAVLRGAQLLLPLLFVAVVFASGLYRLSPVFLFGLAVVLGFLLPEFWLTWRVRRRQHRLLLSLPDALDLLVVSVEAGMGLDQAIFRVAQELYLAHRELSEELQLVNWEMRLGKSRAEALRELSLRTGVEDIKALVAMLIQTDRFGTDLAQALRVQSDDLRTRRRQRAEEMAAKATIKMIPPLVFFIFPALFVVLLGPAVITLVREFHRAVGP